MIDKKEIRKEMRSLMRCMNYALAKSEEKKPNPIYFEMYLFLGTHAWTLICGLCRDYVGHEFKVFEKIPNR
jgi:hypothetical protein